MLKALNMNRAYFSAVAFWIVLVGAIFIWTFVAYSGEADAGFRSEILIRHGLLMILLSMPSGLVALFVLGSLVGWLGIPVNGIGDALLASVACGLAGYLQWFLLLPWLWRKWKEKRVRESASTA